MQAMTIPGIEKMIWIPWSKNHWPTKPSRGP